MYSKDDLALLCVVADSRDGFVGPDEETRRHLADLRKHGLVRYLPYGQRCVITPEGRRVLSAAEEAEKAAEEQAEKEAEEKRMSDEKERKDILRSWWQMGLSLLIGWLLGGITPNAVFAFLGDLLQRGFGWLLALFH